MDGEFPFHCLSEVQNEGKAVGDRCDVGTGRSVGMSINVDMAGTHRGHINLIPAVPGTPSSASVSF